MEKWLNVTERSWTNPKLLLGFIIIYLLDVTINFVFCYGVGDTHSLESDDDHHSNLLQRFSQLFIQLDQGVVNFYRKLGIDHVPVLNKDPTTGELVAERLAIGT